MEQEILTNRQKEIMDLIKRGYCLPREIAFQLKANKTNVSTTLKLLFDHGFIVRAKFYGTYIYASSRKHLDEYITIKELSYSKQMLFEKKYFNQRHYASQ